ncbi:MAG: lysine--tRNA ligase [bacterium]
MATNPLFEIRKIRLEKVKALRERGLNPYPSKAVRTNYAAEILGAYETFDGKQVQVAGRLMSFRKQGALAFGHIQDQSGRIQLFFRRNLVAPTDATRGTLGYADLNLVDLGDIVQAQGKVVKTERGEISILVEEFRILTKAIRPLPDQWSGLKDREQILRKRYLDTTLDRESHQRFGLIAGMTRAIREFLFSRGFIEFNTPIIQPQYGGGTARPFKTHVNALGVDMYLAISHELYLKRLIAGGYDKVFTIGRYFRNEGIDRSHHPEFSMVETMTAYENYEYNMNLVEQLFKYVAENVFGKTEFVVRGHKISFAEPWRRIRMNDAVKEKIGVDFTTLKSADEANDVLKKFKITEECSTPGEAISIAFSSLIEPELIQPTIVYGHPVDISPLAKPSADDPRFAERFEIFIAGMECGDNWSEQNDPAQLLETWKKSYRAEERDSGKFHTLDFDFIEALEYGIPPTTGIGPGVERMAMIFTGQENIDDVIFFPLMRPSISPTNAELYGVQEPPAPVSEDVAFSDDEFTELCQNGALHPESGEIVVKPHWRLWQQTKTGKWNVSGHIELQGFHLNGIIRVCGYRFEAEEKPDLSSDKNFKNWVEKLSAVLQKTFPENKILVSPIE